MRTILRMSLTVLLSTLMGVGSSAIGAAQCNLALSGTGTGGAIPIGGGGVYPTTLPGSVLTSSINVTFPPDATVLDAIDLRDLTHPRLGELQFVLESPSGARHNLATRLSYFGCNAGCGVSCGSSCDFTCDFNGDYTIVGACSCTGYGQHLPTTCTGAAVLPPGLLRQFFGTWPSGSAGIVNTPLEQIPAQNGTWTLYVIDWESGNAGSLGEWEIASKKTSTGNTPPDGPDACVTPASGSMASNPVTVGWAGIAPRATTHKVRRKRGSAPDQTSATIESNPVTVSALTLPNLAFGWWYWEVQSSENGTEFGDSGPACSFCIPGTLASSICIPGGGGGAVPTTGTGDGTWPTVLPSAPLVSTYSLSVPSGATEIVSVNLLGLTHTWLGDLQVVLTDPSGGNHNLLHRVGHTGSGFGLSCDLNGDYTIAPIARIYCQRWPVECLNASILSPGLYDQDFTSWNPGDFGIFNSPLELVPVSSGNWTLTIYDWAGGDVGALAGWEVCFDTGTASPVNYCTSGTTTNGCNAMISATAQPSASFSNTCFLDVSNVEGQKLGLVFYGLSSSVTAWGGGSSFLCVKSPTQRMGVQFSGGTANACNGQYTQDLNAYLAGHPSAVGSPFSSGDKIYAQAWFRDPPSPKSSSLSNAIELTVHP
jgi:subtilisin-like proprotein convertase family protein